MPGVNLWGLLFGSYPISRAKETKIVWRMTGTGTIHVTAVSPVGQEIAPAWGPEAHSSSTWHRPGDEWGTGFVFPVAGCWTLHIDRGPDSTATASVLVTDQ